MQVVQLIAAGKVEPSLLHALRGAIHRRLRVPCEVSPVELDLSPAYHPERQQYHSSEILQRLYSTVRPNDWRILAVTDADLYIPILKYVFGEAQIGGPCAIVSSHRLHQEFYGLERDDELLRQRLLKESVHELGHTLNLHHCEDYRCAMASAHAVEWIDLRENTFCNACQKEMESKTVVSGRFR